MPPIQLYGTAVRSRGALYSSANVYNGNSLLAHSLSLSTPPRSLPPLKLRRRQRGLDRSLLIDHIRHPWPGVPRYVQYTSCIVHTAVDANPIHPDAIQHVNVIQPTTKHDDHTGQPS